MTETKIREGITISNEGVAVQRAIGLCECCGCGQCGIPTCNWCESLENYALDQKLEIDDRNYSQYLIKGMTRNQIEEFLRDGYIPIKIPYPKTLKECAQIECKDCGFFEKGITKVTCSMHEAFVLLAE